MLLSQQCDDPTLQAVLLSMLAVAGNARELLQDTPTSLGHSNVTLLKLFRWFAKESSHLETAVRRAGCGFGEGGRVLSEVQLLVALLRGIGHRCRLILVLHPLPLKPHPSTVVTPSGKGREGGGGKGASGKGRKGGEGGGGKGASGKGRKGGEGGGGGKGASGKEKQGVSCDIEGKSGGKKVPPKRPSSGGDGVKAKGKRKVTLNPEAPTTTSPGEDGESQRVCFGEKLLQFNLQKGLLKSSGGEVEGGGAETPTAEDTGEASRRSVGKKARKMESSGCSEPKRARRKVKSVRGESGEGVASPYFAKQQQQQQGGGVAGGGANRKRSASHGEPDSKTTTPPRAKVRKSANTKEPKRPQSPEFVAEDSEGDDSDEDFKPTRKRRRSLAKATPIKKLKQAMINERRKLDISTETSTSSFPSSSGEVKGDVLGAEVEVLRIEETSSWAEVYLPGRKRWACLHLPSCSVDQSQLCERHCSLPLRYVMAFENSESSKLYTPLPLPLIRTPPPSLPLIRTPPPSY